MLPGDEPAGEQAEPTSSYRQRAAFVLLSAVVGLLLAFPTALVWVHLAPPPRAPLTRHGVLFGEVQLNQEIVVSLWFLIVGLVAGVVAGVLVAIFGYRHGLMAPFAVLVACVVGTAATAVLGIFVFGPNVAAEAATAHVGTIVSDPMSVQTSVAYLGWPIGGGFGAMAGMVGWPKPSRVGGGHRLRSKDPSGS